MFVMICPGCCVLFGDVCYTSVQHLLEFELLLCRMVLGTLLVFFIILGTLFFEILLMLASVHFIIRTVVVSNGFEHVVI